ncbi:TlpA disulfide reductase family protein [Peptoniphilus raoultii]|uniref:TlpA disulfide reductase family protein n=1 Tax=Peptoniphilus raoultii TaxID=1776387 RepID=UPI0008DA87E3|nr:TlpA disulfide reductase family protein [Peptoniphilus raoultii]
MKTKKLAAVLLAGAMLFSLSACGNKGNGGNSSENTKVEENAGETDKKVAEIKAKIQELSTNENKIFEAHKDLWDKLFALADKEDKGSALIDDGTPYTEYLTKLIDKNAGEFTEEEVKILKGDVDKIKAEDAEIEKLQKELEGLEKEKLPTGSDETFPEFTGKDLDGNDVDSSIFSKNAVTVMNFWFNGCAPCVAELKDLDKLNEDLKAKGGQVIGVNTETLDGNEEGIGGAKEIIDAKGIKYQNIYFDSGSEAGKLALGITGFPTTILINREGKIVGDPLLGGIDKKQNYDSLMKQIDEIIAADKK